MIVKIVTTFCGFEQNIGPTLQKNLIARECDLKATQLWLSAIGIRIYTWNSDIGLPEQLLQLCILTLQLLHATFQAFHHFYQPSFSYSAVDCAVHVLDCLCGSGKVYIDSIAAGDFCNPEIQDQGLHIGPSEGRWPWEGVVSKGHPFQWSTRIPKYESLHQLIRHSSERRGLLQKASSIEGILLNRVTAVNKPALWMSCWSWLPKLRTFLMRSARFYWWRIYQHILQSFQNL